ncbi:MAG: carboxypeptidase-like regulatory domain-containing protein, partial [Muribaculaceae bacterium]|nr:carboxypeptidase-like regulatory domain-containing protein [Muribaculaceae bacterium]
MRKLFLILTALAIYTVSALAQNRTVKGEVVSASDGEPLVGATVFAVGTKTATSTDIDGKFVISVPQNVSNLQFSYVGMNTQEVPASSEYMRIALEDSNALSEVV